jgi:hypothetical protein
MSEALGRPKGTTRRHGVHVGIVKRNDDPQNMGRCSVWIPEFGGDPDTEGNWYVVNYASPFAGATPVRENRKDGADQESTQTAYGFWMNPPDLDNHVLVAFANGDVARGYWFACIFPHNMNHAVPGIANNVSTDESLTSQGIYPPVVEYNKWADENPNQPHRPAFEPLHHGLTNQGLYRDSERGRSSSSARREAPSKVFGYSTPRGTSMMVDDNPENEFIRLRTRGGAQVLVHETSGYVYINSKNGNSWIEISDEGIDIYSKKSISVRAEEDLNFRADRDVMIEGQRGVFIRAGQMMTVESGQNTHMKAGTDFKIGAGTLFQAKAGSDLNLDSAGKLTCKSGGDFNADAGGTGSIKAGGNVLLTGSKVHSNGPSAPSAPTVQTPTVLAQGDRINVQSEMPPQQAQEAATQVTEEATATQGATSQLAEQARSIAGPAAQQVQQVSQQVLSQATAISQFADTARASVGSVLSQVQTAIDSGLAIPGMTTQQLSAAAQSLTGDITNLSALQNTMAGHIQSGEGIAALAQTAQSQVESVISRATSSVQQLGNLSATAQGVRNQINAAQARIESAVGGIQSGASGGAGAILRLGTASGAGQLGQIGGSLGQQLASAASGAAGSLLNQATGQITGVVGKAMQGSLGAMQAAKSTLTNVMGDFQNVGNQITGLANNASNIGGQIQGIAGQITSQFGNMGNQFTSAASQLSSSITNAGSIAGQLGITVPSMPDLSQITGAAGAINQQVSQAAQAAQAAGQQLAQAATTAQSFASQLASTAGATQARMLPETTVKTICERMPTHEPWVWHVKEGQASPIQSPEQERADAVAAATVRPGQGATNGETPVPDPGVDHIQTGTGVVTRPTPQPSGALMQVGSALIKSSVLSAMKEAASVANVDVGYLMARASEMGFNPQTKLGSAHGLMQISQGVFGEMVERYGAKLGIGQNDIRDPRANAMIGAMIARENSIYLEEHGLPAGATELSLAHVMGAPVAARFLTNLARDPDANAFANVQESMARSHRNIFYGQDGAARSLEEVYKAFDTRISGKATHFREAVRELEVEPVVQPIAPERLI